VHDLIGSVGIYTMANSHAAPTGCEADTVEMNVQMNVNSPRVESIRQFVQLFTYTHLSTPLTSAEVSRVLASPSRVSSIKPAPTLESR
jgi:hypothetical protein